MMVIMALITTFMTSPVLELLCPDEMKRNVAQPDRPRELALEPAAFNATGD
jgi:hypothetical protein